MNISKRAWIQAACVTVAAVGAGVTTLIASGQSATGPAPSAMSASTRPTTVMGRLPTPIDTGENITQPAVRYYAPAYNVLQWRSIFSKTIQNPIDPNPPRRIFNTGPGEEQVKLTGLIEQDGVYSALMEDSRTAHVLIGQVGTKIAQGTITNITLDYMEYTATDGKPRQIKIGDNLAGTVASQATALATMPSSMPSDMSNVPVLERLRLQRLAEQKAIGG